MRPMRRRRLLPMCRYCAVSGGKRTELGGIRWNRTGSTFADGSEPMQGKIAFRIEVSETSSSRVRIVDGANLDARLSAPVAVAGSQSHGRTPLEADLPIRVRHGAAHTERRFPYRTQRRCPARDLLSWPAWHVFWRSGSLSSA